MRSCAYCGRDLEKDEKCTCPGAMRKRQTENQTSSSEKTSAYTGWQENTYRTGYTKQKRKFHFKKPNFKRPDFKKDANAVSGFTKRFIHDPVNAVSEPGFLSSLQIVIIWVITAVALSLCGFFIASRFVPGVYRIQNLLRYTLSGTVTFAVLEILFTLVLYLINRFLLRGSTKFMTFATRPAAALIPLMLFSLLGAAVNFFSIFACIMLLLTGFVVNIILTYEAMRSEWSHVPSTRTMYLIALSYFVFFVVTFNLIRLF